MADNISRRELDSIIKELMGIQSITPMITKQINRFILEEKMSFKEIARCLVWFVEVNGGKLSLQYGIAIVPNVREAAAKYFKQLELDQLKQAEEARKIVEYQDNNIVFNIKKLNHKVKRPKQLDIGEINIEGDYNND